MRILVLGGDGMLGHALLRALDGRHELATTLRAYAAAAPGRDRPASVRVFAALDVRDMAALLAVAADFRPEAIVNAVGVVKQRSEAKDAIASIEINSLFPHRLAQLARAVGARVLHLSTDCVFSGSRGGYQLGDPPDADDLYGRSKLLGELCASHCVTLRTSMIGLERSRKVGLVEWFLAQPGPVKGYRRAIFSGFTTAELSRIVERVLVRHPGLSGVWHVAAAPISKLELLKRLDQALGRGIRLEPDDEFVCDRSLDGTAFERETGYAAPSWEDMLGELAREVRQRDEAAA